MQNQAPVITNRQHLVKPFEHISKLDPMEQMAVLANLESATLTHCMAQVTCTTCAFNNSCPFGQE